MYYRFQEHNQALADGLAEFFTVSIAEVPRNCLTFSKKETGDDGMEDNERGRRRGGGHLHKSLQTKSCTDGQPQQVFRRNAQQQMPKEQIKAQTLIPKAHSSACCTPTTPAAGAAGAAERGRGHRGETKGVIKRREFVTEMCTRGFSLLFVPHRHLGSALMCQCSSPCARPAMHAFNSPCKQVGSQHTHTHNQGGPRPKHTMSELLPTD